MNPIKPAGPLGIKKDSSIVYGSKQTVQKDIISTLIISTLYKAGSGAGLWNSIIFTVTALVINSL